MSGKSIESLVELNSPRQAAWDLDGFSPSQRASRGVRHIIEVRGLKGGQRLPSEQALAEMFRVSRTTVRKALDDLSEDGVVRRKQNRGCVVTENPSGTSALLGRAMIVVNDLLDGPGGTNPGSSSAGIKQGMFDAAERTNRTLLMMAVESVDTFMTRELIASRPQGLVMLCWRAYSPEARRIAAVFDQAEIPVAAFGMDEIPEAVERYDRVVSDHESGTRKLLELLARHGRKRVLRLWTPPEECAWIAAHNRAYEEASWRLGMHVVAPVYAKGIPAQNIGDPAAFEARTRYLAGHLAEHLTSPNPVDAIMVATDSETFHVAAACRLLGRVPGVDVLIVGYDNYWAGAFEREFESAVPFATVDKKNAVIGEELVRLLDQRISGGAASRPQVSCIEQDVFETRIPTATVPTVTASCMDGTS